MNETQNWVTCSKCSQSFHSTVSLGLHNFEVHNQLKNLSPLKPAIYKSRTPIYTKRRAAKQQNLQPKKMAFTSTPSQSQSGSDKKTGVGLYFGGPLGSVEKDPDLREIEMLVQTDGTFLDQISVGSRKEGSTPEESSQPEAAEHREPELSNTNEGPTDTKAVARTNSSKLSDNPKPQGEVDSRSGLYMESPLLLTAEIDSEDSSGPLVINMASEVERVAIMPVDVRSEGVSDQSQVTIASVLVEQGNSDSNCTCKRRADNGNSQSHDLGREKRVRVQSEFVLDERFIRENETLEAILRQFDEHVTNKDSIIVSTVNKAEKTKKTRRRASTKQKKVVSGSVETNTGVRSSEPTKAAPKKQTSKTNLKESKNKIDDADAPHYLFMKASKEIESKHYVCMQQSCQSTCVGFQAFEDHMSGTHKRFPCAFCHKTFSMRNNRTRHIVSRVIGKQHLCLDCGANFARRDSLKEHRFIHTRSYLNSQCCNCNLSFDKKTKLLSHMKKCFTDDQLITDKISPEEIFVQKLTTLKGSATRALDKAIADSEDSLYTVIEQEPSPVSTPKKPSKSGASVVESQQEEESIPEIKNYFNYELNNLANETLQADQEGQRKFEVNQNVRIKLEPNCEEPQNPIKSLKSKFPRKSNSKTKSTRKQKTSPSTPAKRRDSGESFVVSTLQAAAELDIDTQEATQAGLHQSPRVHDDESHNTAPVAQKDYSAMLTTGKDPMTSEMVPTDPKSKPLPKNPDLETSLQYEDFDRVPPMTSVGPSPVSSLSIPHASDALLSAHTNMDMFGDTGLESALLTNMALAVASVDTRQCSDLECDDKLLSEQIHKPYSLGWYLSL